MSSPHLRHPRIQGLSFLFQGFLIDNRVCKALSETQEVGSYALMTGCGFEQLDYLQCCKLSPLL